ncbi:MAG TPA: DciA family protein [Opitutaceae bacterium]|nr:DciA family protein [Opitutaceae bacterium]
MTQELPQFSKRAEEAIGQFRGVPSPDPPRMKRRPTQDMAALVESIKAKHHLGSAAPADVIRERWEQIVGPANAAYSHAAQFDQDGRRLLILASHSVVRSELYLHRQHILDKIRGLPGCGQIKFLLIRAG